MRRIILSTGVAILLGGAAAGCDSKAPPSGRGAAETLQKAAMSHPRSADPYRAALAFARCMRKHGVPHPNPDRAGNFHLTPHDEQLMRRASPREHEAAERACFHYLKPVVSTQPLSAAAKARAARALREFSRCMGAYGYDYFSGPVVRNFSRGRAFFGFRRTDPAIMKARRTGRYQRAQRACEKGLNAKLDHIIAVDRAPL